MSDSPKSYEYRDTSDFNSSDGEKGKLPCAYPDCIELIDEELTTDFYGNDVRVCETHAVMKDEIIETDRKLAIEQENADKALSAAREKLNDARRDPHLNAVIVTQSNINRLKEEIAVGEGLLERYKDVDGIGNTAHENLENSVKDLKEAEDHLDTANKDFSGAREAIEIAEEDVKKAAAEVQRLKDLRSDVRGRLVDFEKSLT